MQKNSVSLAVSFIPAPHKVGNRPTGNEENVLSLKNLSVKEKNF